MLKVHHVALLFFPLLLGACAPRPAILAGLSSGIDLGPVTLAEAEPTVRESCESSIQRALHRHGFTVDPAGPHVEVEVSFFQDRGSETPFGDERLESGTQGRAGATGAPMSRRTSSTADLTAIIQIGTSKRKVLTSGTADETELVVNRSPSGSHARSSACAMGAERLADAMVEVLNDASR